jgi:two-component system, sensor histidine kinase and response regulator
LLVRYDPRTPRLVEGDNLRLRQILSNLLVNAIKFTERGHVLLNVELLYQEDDQAVIRFLVEDTGIGIPEDRLNHIFEQFTQVDGSTSRRYGGTGLGLAISQQLVAMMGGTITVGSTVGRGSRFFFDLTLPCREEPANASEQTGNDLRGRRAMVVDDQAVNRRILSEYLSTWGMELEAARDATEALQLFEISLAQDRPFDILLLDHAMPGMTGLELAAALSRDPRWAHPPIILLTSLWGHVGMEQCNGLGIKAMLPKPIAASDLFNAVRDCLHMDFGPGCTITTASRPADPEPLPEAESQPSLRVLLVDDHPINRKSATLILQKLNCEVTTAQDGLEALDLVQGQYFDLVFMDVQMPLMDGYEATQAIRHLGGRFEKLPIIALTANAMEGDRERCLEAGMTDYLPKPMPKDTLAAILAAQRSGQEAVEEEITARDDDCSWALDVAALLRQYDNDQDMAREMLQDFLADTPGEIAAIEQALSRRDPGTELIAHRLKGPSSYVGAARLAGYCAGIMDAVRRGHWDAADQELQALQRTWTVFVEESEAWLGSG